MMGGFGYNLDYMIMVMCPALIISGLAQMYIRNAYGKWSKEPNGRRVTGVDTANAIMRNYQLGVRLEGTQQELGDHFSPQEGVVRLSPGVASQPSIASMAIAAHEFGHVQQYAQHSVLIGARNSITGLAKYGGSLSTILIIMGLIINMTGLSWIGVVLFATTTLFSILTLPIELDASRRGMKMLTEMGFFTNENDRKGAFQVLRAAALTYVGAMVISILNLAYYVMLVSGSNRRRS
jgi:uncharacterized protein